MDLNSLIIIEKIASLGTFSAAAKALKLPNSNLSLKVKQLEDDLGQALFTRSTRQVAITDFGQEVLNHAKPILSIKEKIESLAEAVTSEPAGRMRLSAPYDVGLYLLRSIIPPFTKKYNKVQVEVELSNSYVDIISGGYDLIIRASSKGLSDSSITALKLGTTTFRLYAHKLSPYTKVRSIDDLTDIPLLSISQDVKLNHGDGESRMFRSSPQIVVKDMTGIKQATLGMAGIGVLPEFICTDEYSRKSLIPILPDWYAGKGQFFAMFPRTASLSRKNRVFIEFLKKQFSLKNEV